MYTSYANGTYLNFIMYNLSLMSRCLIIAIFTSISISSGLAANEKCERIGGNQVSADWTLLFASSTTIFALKGDEIKPYEQEQLRNVTRNDYGSFQHLSVDVKNNIVHWTNMALGQEGIYKMNIDGTGEPNVVVDTGVFYPEGIAFDWITGNIYFVDKLLGYIAVCKIDPTKCAVVVQLKSFGENKISAIALHPNERIMFWTQQGLNQTIERADMDGRNPITIVSTNLYWPNGITVDEAISRIYWVSGAID